MRKNYLLLGIAVIGLISVFFSGCSEEPGGDLGSFELYTFNTEDSVITAEAHELLLTVYEIENNEVPVTDWKLGAMYVWDRALPGNSSEKWWRYDSLNTNNDWLKAEKRNGKLYINAKHNYTDHERRMKIYVWTSGLNRTYYGVIIVSQLPENPEVDETPFKVQARYKGQLYTTMVTLDENDKLVYESKEFADLMSSLQGKKGLDVIVTESGVMNIFDGSDAEALEAIDDMRTQVAPGTPFGIVAPTIRSRANTGFEGMTSSSLGYCGVFDDNTYCDTHIFSNLTTFDDIFDAQNLKSYGLNDKISSLAVAYNGTNEDVCAVLTVWEDTHFNFEDNDRTKHRVSFIATYKNRQVAWSNLTSLPCINSGNSWNDRISSLSFHFGYYNNYWKDY